MNILFISLVDFDTYKNRNIYCDLIRELERDGNIVYSISPVERRKGIKTCLLENNKLLKLKILNTQKTNIIEKGLSTLLLEKQLIFAVKKYFGHIHFDLVLYPTPPITVYGAVKYIKKRDNARTYLMLKDIFPQNAVDLGMMNTTGLKGLIYKYFRKKEKNLYSVSDKIGCMSQANLEYVIEHNAEISKEKVEICPNSIEVVNIHYSDDEKMAIRKKYGIPLDKTVFVYGGNFGKPQGVDYVIDCLRSVQTDDRAYFVIVGSGTEFKKIIKFLSLEKPSNIKVLEELNKSEYEKMISACDVGLIFLDHRFTIPNFPSRLLDYMQAKLPVLACTDLNSDVGRVICEGGFGWWCESNDANSFKTLIDSILDEDFESMKEKEYKYLLENYSANKCFNIIMGNK